MSKHILAAAALALVIGAGSPAFAAKKDAKTPSNWSYELKNGKPVPKAKRVAKDDGSWVEEVNQGNCVVTRTGRAGEVRETRKCT